MEPKNAKALASIAAKLATAVLASAVVVFPSAAAVCFTSALSMQQTCSLQPSGWGHTTSAVSGSYSNSSPAHV